MAKNSKAADLLKLLGGGNTTAPEPERQSPPAEPRPTKPTTPLAPPAPERPARPAAPVRGKAVQFYLHAEDEKIIRELAAWLAPHRKRINDSLVIKTALRVAKTGHEFLAAYDAAVRVDGRTRQNKGYSRTMMQSAENT